MAPRLDEARGGHQVPERHQRDARRERVQVGASVQACVLDMRVLGTILRTRDER